MEKLDKNTKPSEEEKLEISEEIDWDKAPFAVASELKTIEGYILIFSHISRDETGMIKAFYKL